MTSDTSPQPDPIADIRRATADDVPAILRMMEGFNGEELIEFTPEKLGRGLGELFAHPEYGFVLIAEIGGIPAGYAVLAYGFDIEYGGRDVFLNELYIQPRHRRRGVGNELLRAATASVQADGCHAMHLIVRPENPGAQRLYRRDGFSFDPRMFMTKTLS